jgi:hypothetical protein
MIFLDSARRSVTCFGNPNLAPFVRILPFHGDRRRPNHKRHTSAAGRKKGRIAFQFPQDKFARGSLGSLIYDPFVPDQSFSSAPSRT